MCNHHRTSDRRLFEKLEDICRKFSFLIYCSLFVLEKSYDNTQMQSLLSTQDEREDESFLSTSTFPTAV